ncbi:response regulator [Planktothrix sp. FACHB-1355]|uniref:Adenylate cyclase n=1 Tax=Aerosakkonema funiforme FACHB-1375 TaxID=2949571 RepID=A0A926VKF5_9CYAN|nr:MULTISPECIES: adenylate/guanylate cyclase domain-containing protein [Oscillatoriales]MBD2185537.1 response regulator [Aerosakkonema funiforme FACHB-1375]MBD3560063.1 response regulator [Planktothrix sp. FACHB-1355]
MKAQERQKGNILLVDDTPDNLRLLSSILTERGYAVRKARSGQIALTSVKTALPDLILLDINMPEMDGYEVCSKLKASEQTRDVPVIFISALSEVMDKIKAFAVGGIDYITKPFQTEEVIARVENQLTIARQRLSLQERTAQLEKEIKARQQAEEEIRLLLTMAQAISTATDFDTALEVILQQVCQTTDWIYGEAWIPTTDTSALICSPRWYCQREKIDPTLVDAIARFREYSEVLTFYPGEEIPGKVWSTRQSACVNDFNEMEDALLRLELATQCDLKAAFGVPIVPMGNIQQPEEQGSYLLSSQSPVLAVLVFFALSSSSDDKRLCELVSVVAAQSGTVLQQKKVQAEMKALFAAMTDTVVVRDVSGRCLNVIPTNTMNLYKPATETIGRKVHETLPEAEADLILQAILEAVSTQKTVEIEYSLPIGGKDICFAETISPLSSETAILVARDITERKQAQSDLQKEQEKSEQLLLNILPEAMVERLKENPGAIAEHFHEVTILFADIVGFTLLSARISPTELVNLLNEIFSKFDELTEKHGLEKIKTIGDAYMVVGGLPVPKENSAEAIADMALDMQAAIDQFQMKCSEKLQIRIGINTGAVVAGVIGMKKFIYDLWGDAVNVASRMESSGIPGKIQVTSATYEKLKNRYKFEKRGKISVKGRGEMITYWLVAKSLPK